MSYMDNYKKDEDILNGIKQSLSILDKLFKGSQDSIIIIGRDGTIQEVNPAFTEMTGYSEQETVGKDINLLKNELIQQDFFKEMWQSVIKVGFWKGEMFNKKKNGDIYSCILSVEANYENNKIKNFLAILRDISEIKEQKKELARLDNYDYLTNLPNRKLLLKKLEKSIDESNKNKTKLAVIFLDLDDFKDINDKYGHNFGDLLLLEIAKDLSDFIETKDLVSRIGGDEFVIVLGGFNDNHSLNLAIDKIMKRFSNKEYKVGNNKVEVSVSMGVAVYPDMKATPDELMRNADQAMYKAKQQGKRRFIYFDKKQDEESIVHYTKIKELTEALTNGELRLWYQPKISAKNHKVVGFECLIRWIKPDGKVVPAGEFVDTIYGNELDYMVGYFVIKSAFKTQNKWKEKYNKIFDLSINISPDHLLHESFEKDLIELAKKYDTNLSTITLEILETTKIADMNEVIDKMKNCINKGVNFSLDDFGTGYSSLGYLRAIPTNEVKIDRSFVMSMMTNNEDRLIISSIVGLSHALNRVVVAEGVETEDHMKILRDLNVDILQGFGISRPIPEEKLLDWLHMWESKHS